MKYGLECEFFVSKDGKIVGGLPNDLTPDECGFLAEARGQPQSNILEAVYSLKADIYNLTQRADSLGYTLIREPLVFVPRDEILKSRRLFSKGRLEYQNLYGYKEHSLSNKKTAGIHISFSDPQLTYDTNGKLVGTCFCLFDFVQLFRKLDTAFATEIKNAKRKPGFYEIKSDKRIEYRSLPNNVDLHHIIEVLS